jgi:hypothetical protein
MVGTAQWEMQEVKIVLMGRAHQASAVAIRDGDCYVTGTGIEVSPNDVP